MELSKIDDKIQKRKYVSDNFLFTTESKDETNNNNEEGLIVTQEGDEIIHELSTNNCETPQIFSNNEEFSYNEEDMKVNIAYIIGESSRERYTMERNN